MIDAIGDKADGFDKLQQIDQLRIEQLTRHVDDAQLQRTLRQSFDTMRNWISESYAHATASVSSITSEIEYKQAVNAFFDHFGKSATAVGIFKSGYDFPI